MLRRYTDEDGVSAVGHGHSNTGRDRGFESYTMRGCLLASFRVVPSCVLHAADKCPNLNSDWSRGRNYDCHMYCGHVALQLAMLLRAGGA
jgi:hypothetical protein